MKWEILRLKENTHQAEDTYDSYFKQMETTEPDIEIINETTLFLRIPSFSHFEKPKIDKLILDHTNLLSKYENLIIDLRNNGGGSDISYNSIVPLLYTNPVRSSGVQFLSTELNNSRMEGISKDTTWSVADREWASNYLTKLQNNIGEFVNYDSSIVEISKLDTIYKYPKKVGILINENCGSTTEQFLLLAKQSQKVKLFGTTTYGALDISNMYHTNSPSGHFTLWYSLSKSFRIPSNSIDGKGIQPDYYIDTSIPKYEWVTFTEKTLNTY